MLKQITIQVEAPIADAYQNTTPENRQALRSLVSIFLQCVSQPTPLQKVVQEIRLEAQQKGLRRFLAKNLPKTLKYSCCTKSEGTSVWKALIS